MFRVNQHSPTLIIMILLNKQTLFIMLVACRYINLAIIEMQMVVGGRLVRFIHILNEPHQ